MAIHAFTKDLVQALTNRTIPRGIRSERHLEEKFVVPAAVRVAASYPGVLLYTHPWSKKDRCEPGCAEIPPRPRGWVVGCKKCWTDSKAWANVTAFGTRHTFDLAARDRSKTLVVEVKLLKERNGRMPNGELQRFLGNVHSRQRGIMWSSAYAAITAPRKPRGIEKPPALRGGSGLETCTFYSDRSNDGLTRACSRRRLVNREAARLKRAR